MRPAPRHQISEAERLLWVWLHENEGKTRQEIAKKACVSWQTVDYQLKQHYAGGHYRRGGTKKQAAPKQAVVERIERRRSTLKRLAVKRNARKGKLFASLQALQGALRRDHAITVSKMTVMRDMKALGFVNRVRSKVPTVSTDDYTRRLEAALRFKQLRPQRIVFSDEKTFTNNDFTCRTEWVKPGETPQPMERRRWPCTIMVWGAIGFDFKHLVLMPKGQAVTADLYKRRCLQGRIVTHLVANDLFLMQDGAGAHRAGSTMNYLESKGAKVLEGWPARSPDLNPIETLWALMQTRVSLLVPRTEDELITAINRAWEEVPMSTVNALVMSFQRRCSKVIVNKGVFV